MNFFELVNARESVRGYDDKVVSREIVVKILEAAQVSPSACNAQPWKFIVIDNEELAREMGNKLYNPLIGINKFALTAKCFIVIVGEKRNVTSKMGELIKKKDYTNIDIGIAAEHICLAATELGLGSCMMGWFDEKGIKGMLDIPRNKEIHLVISLGYYDKKEPRKKVRKNIEEIVSYNNYK